MRKILSATILATAVLAACSTEELGQQSRQAELRVTATIEGTRVSTHTPEFQQGDQFGLFVTDEDRKPIAENASNRQVLRGEEAWEILYQTITLGDDDAYAYGYYPYTGSNSDNKIAMDINTGTDGQQEYLYTGPVTVNAEQPVANMVFRHALPELDFEVYKDELRLFEDMHLFTATLRNINGHTAIATTGTMDVFTGDIVATPNSSNAISIAPGADLSISNYTTLKFLVMPATVPEHSVQLSLVINGTTHTIDLPAGEWLPGRRYIYTIVVGADSKLQPPHIQDT